MTFIVWNFFNCFFFCFLLFNFFVNCLDFFSFFLFFNVWVLRNHLFKVFSFLFFSWRGAGQGPNSEKVMARRGGARKVSGPKFRVFFTLPPHKSFFSSLSGGLLVELCLKRRGPSVHVWVLWLLCEAPGKGGPGEGRSGGRAFQGHRTNTHT